MGYRDELDKMAHEHGYEEQEAEGDCQFCIHRPMCSGENCHFDRKWEPEDLEKRYYHVNDWEDRLSDELYSKRDIAEMPCLEYVEGSGFITHQTWRSTHPKRNFRVRMTIEVNVDARDEIEARKLACDQYGLKDRDLYPRDGSLDQSRMADVDVVHQYRMPVKYIEDDGENRWGYDYTFARYKDEAELRFREKWDHLDAIQDYEDIEEFDEYGEEWN